MGNCDGDQAKKMFSNFFPMASKQLIHKMQTNIENIKEDNPLSPAALENFLSRFKYDANEAVDNFNILEESLVTDTFVNNSAGISVYRYFDGQWVKSGKPRAKRDWDSLVLTSDFKKDLLNDVEVFFKNRIMYQEHGVSYRRGYLFSGPNCTGQYSSVLGLASKLDYSICIIDLTEQEITNDNIVKRMESVPSKSIMLIQNIEFALSMTKMKTGLDSREAINRVQSQASRESTESSESGIEKEKEEQDDKKSLTVFGICNALDSYESETSPIYVIQVGNKENVAPELLNSRR